MDKGSFTLPNMSVEFVRKEVKSMSNAKATGLDGISVQLLKISLDAVDEILTFIFNFSIESGYVENDWKRARVTPLFKSGDEHVVNNYRPVSVLPIVSKIIERHVFNSFYEYLSENGLITKCQSGFRPKHSCETALNELIDRWLKHIDEGKLTGVLFIDLSKAFDTVNHDVLLHKLLSFGICDKTFLWFKSYLTDRVQSVGWRGAMSKPQNVTIGVPQESILGPLFFILFVNDYPDCLEHSHATIYADDTSKDVCDKSVDVIVEKLTTDLFNSLKWMKQNKLTMNLKKTQCMLIVTCQRLSKCKPFKIQIGDIVLETVKSAKLLGIHIDNCLTWSTHLDLLSSKISRKLGVLRRLRPFMSNDALLKIYNCIVFPHFNYCCTAWSDAKNRSNVDRLFKLQKRAARIILGVRDVLTPTHTLLRQLKWMPLLDYFIFRKLILTFKVLHQMTPEYLNVFKYVHEVHTRVTRQSLDRTLLFIPRARTEYFKRSFVLSCSALWNNLTSDLRNCTTLESFKRMYLEEYFNR